ncbi:hypothetical protein HYU50_02245 [Candidatus Woesearchaeota archaeon]|nr:hypothetical protein [Candidatus Woesearchaeota archaeon]
MTKNFTIITIAVLMILSLFLFVGCAAKQPEVKAPTPPPPAPSPPVVVETPADDVAAGISGINNAENELDSSGLEDIDSTLADIEKI